MTTAEKIAALRAMGFIAGPRDVRLNTKYSGAFMVTETDYTDPHYGYELPTEDGANGPWCIVGDNLDALVAEAYEVHKND